MTKTQPSSRRSEPSPIPISAALTQAELSFQRGDFSRARDLLENRMQRGNDDFRTRNLLAISQANLGQFDRAEVLFTQLKQQSKGAPQKAKAGFNLGLLQFYQDLAQFGDLSVANTLEATPSRIEPAVALANQQPFSRAIETWQTLTRGKMPYQDHTHTFLSFAYLQFGDLDKALKHIVEALEKNESFFLAQYTLGRLFLDLFLLANEGNEFLLPQSMADYFEIEDYEITKTLKQRIALQPYTFLDIALQAFLAGRAQAPTAIVILNFLCQTYMLADMFEEARDVLNLAESLAPDWLSTLNLSLKYQESAQAPAAVIRALIKRIELARRIEPYRRIFEVMPPHYLV